MKKISSLLPAPPTSVGAANRFALRPLRRRITPPSPITPPCAVAASAELFDRDRGGTTVVFSNR